MVGATQFGENELSVVKVTPLDLRDLREKLVSIKNVATRMTIKGYDVFQNDEEWEYIAEHDTGYMGVCPICYGFDLNPLFYGDMIPSEFSRWSWENKPKEIHPQTHDDHVLPNGEPPYNAAGEPKRCRCRLHWRNFPEPIIDKLVTEMQEEVL